MLIRPSSQTNYPINRLFLLKTKSGAFARILDLEEFTLRVPFVPACKKLLALADAVTNPTEMSVDGFGTLLFDTVLGNTSCRAVVSLDQDRWFWMSKFFETSAQGARSFFCNNGIQCMK